MIAVRRTMAAAIFAGFILGGMGRAFAAPPTDADTPEATLDNQSIHRDSAANPANSPAASAKTNGAAPSGGFDSARVAIALTVVIGLIFVLRFGLRRVFPGAVPQRSTRAMQVLCRFTISPRQHLLLVQVGKRLIVVGDGGAQLNPLCEITSQDEVEAIVAQVREESATSLKRFEMFFGKAPSLTPRSRPRRRSSGRPSKRPTRRDERNRQRGRMCRSIQRTR